MANSCKKRNKIYVDWTLSFRPHLSLVSWWNVCLVTSINTASFQYIPGKHTTAIPRVASAAEFIEPTQGFDSHVSVIPPNSKDSLQNQFDRSQVRVFFCFCVSYRILYLLGKVVLSWSVCLQKVFSVFWNRKERNLSVVGREDRLKSVWLSKESSLFFTQSGLLCHLLCHSKL